MNLSWARRSLATVGVLAVVGASVFAQTSTTDENKRKVKSRLAPQYPELAKRAAELR